MAGDGCSRTNRTRLVAIPFETWSSGGSFSVFARVGRTFSSVVREESVTAATTEMRSGGSGTAYRFVGPVWVSGTEGYAEIRIQYTGAATLSKRHVAAWIPLKELFACPVYLDDESPNIPLSIELQAAPVFPVSVSVPIVTAVSSIAGGLSGMPGGIVRAGMVSSLVGMMRCSDFDATEEIDSINNPTMWAVGATELQYQRGSLIIGVLILVFGAVIVVVGMVLLRSTHKASTLVDALQKLRLPSMFVVIVMIVSEVCMKSLSTMLLYRRTTMITGAVAADYLISVVMFVALWSYLLRYAYVCTLGMRVSIVELGSHDTTPPLLVVEDAYSDSNDSSDSEDLAASMARIRRSRSTLRRTVVYLLEPTHGPRVVPVCDDSDDDIEMQENVTSTEAARRSRQSCHAIEAERWLCANFYFIAERRWVAFGAAEAVVGALVDFVEGVPVTSSTLVWCLFPPILMAVMLACLVVLLLWKRPFAIRLQQCSTTLVMAMLLVATIMIIVNIILGNEELERVTGVILMVTSAFIALQSILDVVMWIMMMVPGLRVWMGLRDTSLGSLLRDMRQSAWEAEADTREAFDRVHNRGNDPALPYLSGVNDRTTDPDAIAWNTLAAQVLVYRLRQTAGKSPPSRSSFRRSSRK